MQFGLLAKTAGFLILSQLLFGAVGFAAKPIPWLGLLLPLVPGWLIVRTALVLREEMTRGAKVGVQVIPLGTAIFVALLWQLPTLAVMPWWAPSWALEIWQGALLSLPLMLNDLTGWRLPMAPWLLAASLVEMALFAGVAGRALVQPAVTLRGKGGAKPAPAKPAVTARPTAEVAAAAASEDGAPEREWAPARRHKDVSRRNKRR